MLIEYIELRVINLNTCLKLSMYKIILLTVLIISPLYTEVAFSQEFDEHTQLKKLFLEFNTFGSNDKTNDIIDYFKSLLENESRYKIVTFDKLQTLTVQKGITIENKVYNSEERIKYFKQLEIDYLLTVTISETEKKFQIMMRFYSIEHHSYDIYNATIFDETELKELLERIVFEIKTSSADFPVVEQITLCPMPSKLPEHTNVKVNTDPDDFNLFIDDKYFGKTPCLVEDLPVGEHVLKLTHKYFHDSTTKISFDEIECNTFNFVMTNKKTGQVYVTSNLPYSFVSIDGSSKGAAPDTFNVDYGSHFIGIKSYGGEYAQKVEIESEEVPEINAVFNTYISLTGLKDAEVFMRDKLKGKLPLLNKKIDPGKYNINIKKPGYETEEIDTYIYANDSLQYNVELKRRSLSSALLYSMAFPGWGQVYSERSKLNLSYGIVEIGGLITIFILNNNMNELNNQYDDLFESYHKAISNEEFILYHRKIDAKYDEITKTENYRDAMIYTVAGWWVWNMIDTYINWPFDENFPGYNISINNDMDLDCSLITVSIPLN